MTAPARSLRKPAARAAAVILVLAAFAMPCFAASDSWSTGGPITDPSVEPAVYSLAVTADGSILYAGFGNGSVFSRSIAITVPPPTTTAPATSTGSSGTGSYSSGSHVTSTGHESKPAVESKSPPSDNPNGNGNGAPPGAGGPAGGSGSTGATGGTSSEGTGPLSPMTTVLVSAGGIGVAGSAWYIRQWRIEMRENDPLWWRGGK